MGILNFHTMEAFLFTLKKKIHRELHQGYLKCNFIVRHLKVGDKIMLSILHLCGSAIAILNNDKLFFLS